MAPEFSQSGLTTSSAIATADGSRSDTDFGATTPTFECCGTRR
jgi:hypothetical protein